MLNRIGGLVEAVETQLLQLDSQIGHRKVREQDDSVLVDVRRQMLGVEVVLVQMRDVEVIAVTQCVPIQVLLSGKGNQEAKYAGLTQGRTECCPPGSESESRRGRRW